jgi:hypothetical protein
VEYNRRVTNVDLKTHLVTVSINQPNGKPTLKTYQYDSLISTIPLNELVILAGLDARYPVETTFRYRPVYVKITLKPPEALYRDDVVYVNYISNPLIQPYRYCDRFGERHYETLHPIGFPHKKLFPGKIWAAPNIPFILQELEANQVYCFGRYGAWAPDELLHTSFERIVAWRSRMGRKEDVPC